MERNRPHLSREVRHAQRARDWFYARAGVDEAVAVDPINKPDVISGSTRTKSIVDSQEVRNPAIKYDIHLKFPDGGIPFGPGSDSTRKSG